MDLNNLFDKLKHEAKALTGNESKDTFFSSEAIFPDEETAKKTFPEARKRLFDINKWTDKPDLTTPFELYNNSGKKTTSDPQKGNFIKITLPGIPVENWVEIIELYKNLVLDTFTVHPCSNYIEREDNTQHFVIQKTDSTFKVERQRNKITATESGRIEFINYQEEAGNRAVLNTLIAEGGW